MSARNSLRLVVLVCWAWLNACVLDSMASPSAAQITGFDLLTGNNPELTQDAIGVITDSTITLNVPADTDLTSLIPTIQHNGDHLSPAPGEPQDFSAPVDYSVIAADGSAHVYHVTVISAPSSRKEIKTFRIENTPGVINGTDITLTVPFGTDVTMLRGFVSYTGDRISPESGSVLDFTNPIPYTVYAQDGSSTTYTVTVTVAPSDAKDITQLTINEVTAEIKGTQISLTLQTGTDVHALEPSIVFTGASIEPASGAAQDFSAPVKYRVTAADGSTQDYVVTVSVARSDAKEITQLTWNGHTAVIEGNAITLTVPYGTDVTSITPVISYTGRSINPPSGITRNFSQPVEYTVTAADGSTRVYSVTVSVALNTAHEITDFVISGVHGLISGTTITLSLPFGTDPSSLAPTISHTGASVAPQSGVARDFSSPVSYTVTAADGSSKVYSVTVTVAKNNAREITAFSLLGVAASSITVDTITVTVPYGSVITSVIPVITHTGVKIDPADTLAQDFSHNVVYTVTAGNGKTRDYTVKVTVAPNPSKDITSFSLAGVAGIFGPNSIALTLPHDTDLSMLQPAITINGASVRPSASATQNFTSPVTYTVTADDGSTKQYTVTVTQAKTDTKELTGFSVAGVTGKISASGVSVTMPNGTDLTTLKPTVTIAGKSVAPASGVQTDFTNPVMYTITADDATTKSVLVTITAAAADAKDITTFSILGVPATITSNTIALTLPSGTNAALLTPTIEIDGKSVSPASLTRQSFLTPQVYTVTAADMSTKDYTVTVNIAAGSDKDILTFDILGITPSIGADTVTLTVPMGTNLTALTPTVAISGASVSPASGQTTDFTAPVTYTVKDATGASKTYTVTVSSAS